ncbi:pentapeptide repeat-containing protein [Halorarius halobius]|uniref:pentapeptide repeat-containing protein n=1 Tax=Halorarius halobius TaxID=2962671 RepID=UPI0020CBD949|nr:pentapeptide repeat-containing protein [Halorarius halobius]
MRQFASGRTAMVLVLVVAALVGGTGIVNATADRTGATVSPEPRAANAASTHTVTADGPYAGNLSRVRVAYGGAGDVDGVTVRSLGVDRDGDGLVDRQFPAAVGVRSGTVHVAPEVDVTLSSGDRIVLVLGGISNPERAGVYDAEVTVATTAGTHTAATEYRVTPFAAPGSAVRNATAPRSSVERVVARGSTLHDTRLARSSLREVTMTATRLDGVTTTADRWRDVSVADSTLADVASRRSTYRSVAFESAGLCDATVTESTLRDAAVVGADVTDADLRGVEATGVAVVDTRVDGLAVADSTLDGVAVVDRAPRRAGDDPAVAVGDLLSTRSVVETVEGRYDAARTDVSPGDNRVSNVRVRDSTLRNVRLVNATLENVTFRGVTLRNVTLRNVTLRGVTVTDRTLADGRVTGETVTSERRLVYEMRTDDGVDAPVTVTAGDGSVSVAAGPANVSAGADGGSAEASGSLVG